MIRGPAEFWLAAKRLKVLTLALVLFLCGCQDQIPVATPGSGDRWSEHAGRGETPSEPAVRADMLRAAVAVSVSARSLVGALGRPGAPIADRAFPEEVAAIQRRTLQTLLDTFRTNSYRFFGHLPEKDPFEADEWRSHLTGYSMAANHTIETTEHVVRRGVADRVHSLYVDRLNQHVVALVLEQSQDRQPNQDTRAPTAPFSRHQRPAAKCEVRNTLIFLGWIDLPM